MTTNEKPVTVIGLGPMGQAMVRKFLAAGHPTTVWNRTPSRADALVEEGAVRAASPAEAVAASELVVLSLTDYQAMYDILGRSEDALAGRVVANLSSDSPEKTREAAAWLAERGAQLLAGGVMVPPPMVGEEGAYVFYSGPREALDAHEPTLRVLGRPDYRGTDPALAQLFYQSLLAVFLTALAAELQAAALVGSAGVSAKELAPYVRETLELAAVYADETARDVDTRTYPGDLSTATMMGATADHIVAASTAAGLDTALPEAVKSLYDRAVAAGHGNENWTSLYEVVARTR
ncbi:3-hydroxyisobutyrate dehydrogenase-like beta-hydroxyacid dehydrogenase [Pseudonocardia hierapolitana]|uniref:3-hydroxyisobutyrate dehydrogenase-like beta-hydroxyacid dehydrogenase n=1 Tax=Pseudonocardia hierapolitana TaxID=1128676 RepID=A0A561SX72_9PSEU|nr:NAD(P)-binding domain-containing protein [Pseudonocardia hierapolitana]TWF79459.1 3-hydroxyisobutyrate dehydrogenase-like beta-hydroxyacid dehydrogenase [Pseudonocardia hierapolitana]